MKIENQKLEKKKRKEFTYHLGLEMAMGTRYPKPGGFLLY
jgi:hypothetical protein